MSDQTIDAIKVKLGVDAADIKNQVATANTALDALGSHAKRVVKVELQTTLQTGGSEAIKRLEMLKNKGIDVKVGVQFRQSGESSIAAMRRTINTGLIKAGSIEVPVKIELNDQQARGLMNSVQRAVNAAAASGKSVVIPFTWEASEPPKYTGDPIKVNWTWGDGPSGSPSGGPSGSGPGPGSGPAPAAGGGAGRSRTSSRTSTSGAGARPSPDDVAAEKAAKESARADRRAEEQATKTARERERDSRQQQADQQQARTTGTATGSSGSGSTGRQTRAEKSAANKAAHATARAEKRAEQAAEKAALIKERDALKAAQSNPATPHAAAPAAASAPPAAAGGWSGQNSGQITGRASRRGNYIAGGARPRGVSRDRGPLPSSVPRHGYTVADQQGMNEADRAMEQSRGTRTGLRVGDNWDSYVENIASKAGEVDFSDPAAFTEYLRSLPEDERKKFWKQYRTTGETSKRDSLGRIKDPKVHAQFMAVLRRQAERRAAEVAHNPGAVNLTGAAKGRAGVRSGGTQSQAGMGGPRGKTEKKEKLADTTIISGEAAPDIESTASQKVWQDIRVPEAAPRIQTNPELLRMTPEQRLAYLRAEDEASGFTQPAPTDEAPKKRSRKSRRAHLQSEVPGTPRAPLSSLGERAGPTPLLDDPSLLDPEVAQARKTARYKELRDIRLQQDQDRRLGISRTNLPVDKQYGPALPAGLMGKIDLPSVQTEADKEAAHAAGIASFKRKRAETSAAAEAARGDIASRAVGSEGRSGIAPRVRIAGIVERGLRAKWGSDVDPKMVEQSVKSTLSSGWPIEKVAKFWGIDKYAEGGLYSRKIGHKFADGESKRSIASLNTSAWKKIRGTHLRANPYCKHCGVGRVEARKLGMRLSVDAIQSEAQGGSHTDPENLQTLCTSCNSRKSGFSHQPESLWDNPRPSTLLGHPKLEANRDDFLPGGRYFGASTLRQALKVATRNKKKVEKRAEGGLMERLEKAREQKLGPKLEERKNEPEWMRRAREGKGVTKDMTYRAEGGFVKHGGLLERMAQAGHQPSVTMMGERGPELAVTDPNTGQSEIVPTHKVPTWLQRSREGHGVAKDMTYRAEGGAAPFGRSILPLGGGRGAYSARMARVSAAAVSAGTASSTAATRVFVVNWPAGATAARSATPSPTPGATPPPAAPSPAAAAAAAGGPAVGAPATPMAGASPAAAAAAAGGAGGAGGAAGGGAGGRMGRTTYRDVALEARMRRMQARLSLVDMQSEVMSAKSLTPARAFTTSIAQLSEQASGRAGIQKRAKEAEVKISIAGQMESAYEGERAKELELQKRRRLLHRRGVSLAAAGQTLDPKDQEELDRIRNQDLPEQRAIRKEAGTASERRRADAQAATKDILRPGDVTKTLLAGFVGLAGGTVVMKAAFTALNAAIDTGGKAMTDFAEMQLGYVNTAAQMGKSMGEAVIQQNGNTQAVVANTMAMSGMNDETSKIISGALGSRAETIAGNDASQKRIEAMAAAGQFAGGNRPAGLPEGFDTNLVKSVGGFMDLGFGPGATAPIAEQLQNYIGRQFAMPAPTPASVQAAIGPEANNGGYGVLGSGDPQAIMRAINGEAPIEQPAGPSYTPEAMAAYDKRVDQGLVYLNEQAEVAGNTLKVTAKNTEGAGKATKEWTVQILKNIGADQLASEFASKDLAIPGLDQTDQRKSEFQVAEWLKAQNTYAQSPAELLKEGERARGAQVRSFDREQVRGVEQEIPAAIAMKYLARPMTPYGAKTLPQGGPAGNVPVVAKSGPFADQGGGAGMAEQYAKSYEKYSKPALAAQKMVTAEITKGKDVLLNQYKVPPDLINGISDLGQQIQKVQKGIEQRNLNLTIADYNNQIRVSNRSLGDARDLYRAISGHAKDTLGGMQGQNIALGRQLQLLGFEMQQRQINFKLATAGFVAPGTTPEERAARIKAAEKEAEIAQRMLDLQKKMGSNQIKITGIEAGRSVTDLTAQLSLLTQGKSLAIDTKAAQDSIEAMNQSQEILIENANTFIKKGQKTVALIDASITEIEARTGKVFSKWSDDLAATFKAAGVAYAQAIIDTMDPSQYGGNSNDGPKTGGGARRSASGMFGTFNTPTTATFGEAGTETVAILRNPRTLSIGGGGGGGGGTMVFNININGGSDMDRKKFDALAREIAGQVEGRMMQKTNLFALRRGN